MSTSPPRLKVLTRPPVVAWALTDWANSAFATTVMAGFFPVFFKQYWNAGVAATESTFRLGLVSTIASVAVAVLAPMLGALADRGGTRVRMLIAFTLLGAAGTVALGFVAQGQWIAASACYLVASLGFWGSIVFGDSLLLHVAEPDEYDLVSGYGYSLGYLGGGLLFAVNVLMTLKPGWFGLDDVADAVRWSFVSVGVWWVVFALPCAFLVHERGVRTAPAPFRTMVRQAVAELGRTARDIVGRRHVLWFLLAYVIYIDGVNTVIKMAVDYGLSLGFEQSQLVLALLLTQFVAFPAALAFGWLGGRIGAPAGIFVALAVYVAATGYAYFMDDARDFYVLAVTIGLVQGGIQSLSRSHYGSLVPPEKSSEYFGFYNMVGKASAIVGPALVGVTAAVTGDSRLAILSILVLFVAGGTLLAIATRRR